jgi:hypothetical protein
MQRTGFQDHSVLFMRPPLVTPTYRRRVNKICTDLVSTPDLYMLYAT